MRWSGAPPGDRPTHRFTGDLGLSRPDAAGLSVSPEHTHLVYTTQSGLSLMLDLETHDVVTTLDLGLGALRSLQWSPDSTRVLAISISGSGVVWSAQSGSVLDL